MFHIPLNCEVKNPFLKESPEAATLTSLSSSIKSSTSLYLRALVVPVLLSHLSSHTTKDMDKTPEKLKKALTKIFSQQDTLLQWQYATGQSPQMSVITTGGMLTTGWMSFFRMSLHKEMGLASLLLWLPPSTPLFMLAISSFLLPKRREKDENN